MRHFVWLVLALILSMLIQAPDACTEKRITLVIGNGAYVKVPKLPNPRAVRRFAPLTLRTAAPIGIGGFLATPALSNCNLRF